ncbi:MAG: S8 family serine peptidase [Chloroflexi bacterium]|nr:S8 family serine peptidase [Chloroflexota bacterium]
MIRSNNRRATRAAVCGLAIALGAALVPAATVSAAAPTTRLSKAEHQLIAEARARGEQSITVLIATTPGSAGTVMSGLKALGGVTRYREDDVKYLRATVPLDKVEAAAGLKGVRALDVDEVLAIPDVRPADGVEGIQGVAPQTAPGAGTPAVNSYMPTGDTGAAQFVAAHPTWDGRGVTIGIVDSGVTLDHPSLLTTSTGERKIVDWVTGTDPFSDDDPTWVNMAAVVSGASFSFAGTTYTAPVAGSYRIGRLNEADPRLGGEVGNNLNRDGDTTDRYAVLWNTSTNDVWVDANTNNSFADEPAMTDYKVRNDVGTFGIDNAATPIRESMPFVVQTDGKNKFVNIGIVSGAHGSHVAGIAAGKSLFGGAMDGAAPGAKIVSSRACMFITGCTAHALFEGMIFVAKQGNVDVINMSIGGLPALNDGNNARAVLYSDLIEKYNVQMFISAGNSGAGLNTIGDPSVATKVMSMGSYITDDTWRTNYGSDSTEADNLHPFSSRGPREDGGFKPQAVAPGSAISTTPLWQAGGPLVGTYDLPPGYSMFNGTSMASPQGAGVGALLVSAAQQSGAQHQPAQIRQALISTSRYLTGYQASDQGNGLLDTAAAWNLLKTNIKTADISSAVENHSPLAAFLATPGVGPGIYDRDGTTQVGVSYTRTYTFKRTSGPGGTTTYNLGWVGNDGTFSSAGSIALPLNVAKTLVVTVNAATVGLHSAILNVNDPATAGIDYQTMNTVVAAETFSAGSNFAVTKSGTIGRNQTKSYFYNVPAGTPAFKVDITVDGTSTDRSAAGTGQVRFLRFHPWGVGIESNSTPHSYNPVNAGCGQNCTVASASSRTQSNPAPGVWEVVVEARRTSDTANAPFVLTASILGATITPNPDVIASATIGVPIARSYTATNTLGAFTGRMVGTTLGSARRGVFSIANLATQQYATTVTAGSTSFRATIGSPSDPGADLDLFVFNCTSGTCVLAGQSADGDSEESVTIANPAAGTWVVLVDGFAVPAGTTTYRYIDVFGNPAFGSIAVTDANGLRPSGASWTVPASVTANAAPAAGRVLYGNVQVRTDGNVLVGQSDVIIEAVNP